jgi:lysophospholipase L1-like esterase
MHLRTILLALITASASAQQPIWTGTWAAAPVAASTAIGPEGTTFRDIVHLSIGGRAIRLRISNEGSPTQLTLDEVRAALATAPGSSAIESTTDHAVTFGGTPSVTIPAGTYAISDPIPLPVKPFTDLAVSIFVPAQSGITLTAHVLGTSTNFAAPGNATAKPVLEDATKISSWTLLKGVDVESAPSAAAVVVLGASIADGFHSTPDKNSRWPDDLAQRLAANPATHDLGVLNEGISGNRVLHDGTGPSALARFDRDVLTQSGVRYLILALATNDIGRTFFPSKPGETVTADQIEWGYQQIVLRAHAGGIKVIGTTLNPFSGAGYFNADGEKMRQAVNKFTLTSRIFDGVIDFDQATRDPAQPDRLLPAFDSGDHLHPNDTGYKAMADAINLKLFTEK